MLNKIKECSYKCAKFQGSSSTCTECRFVKNSERLPNCVKPINCFKYLALESMGDDQGDDLKLYINDEL